ncbi:hypothetical protein AVEN_264247-1, partial [Araneus ventricosus]
MPDNEIKGERGKKSTANAIKHMSLDGLLMRTPLLHLTTKPRTSARKPQ